MKNKRQNQILIGVIVFAIGFMLSYFHVFSPLSFAGGFTSNSVVKTFEDASSMKFQITSSAGDKGSIIEQNSATDGQFSLSFGGTSSSDTKLGGYSDPTRESPIQVLKYPFKNLQISGIQAFRNFGSSNQTDVSDVRIVLKDGFCTVQSADNLFDRNNFAIGFNCKASGDLKAYVDNVDITNEPNTKFFGGTSATIELTTLKHNVHCVEDQLVNCAENQICSANNCMTLTASPPPVVLTETQPSQTQTTGTTNTSESKSNILMPIIFMIFVVALLIFLYRKIKRKG